MMPAGNHLLIVSIKTQFIAKFHDMRGLQQCIYYKSGSMKYQLQLCDATSLKVTTVFPLHIVRIVQNIFKIPATMFWLTLNQIY